MLTIFIASINIEKLFLIVFWLYNNCFWALTIFYATILLYKYNRKQKINKLAN